MVIKIAIIGAGPAGCTLARLLQADSERVSVTVFESEASLNFRSQGGTLDLHEETGQLALKRAGLFDEFLKYARYDGEAFKIADKNLLYYIRMAGSKQGAAGSGRPEIDRPQLRRLLFESLREGTVQWSKKITKIADGLTVHFADGTTQTGFDLIVGADGAWSKARPLLSDVKPFYSGIAGHSMTIPDAANKHPELYDLVNRGSIFAWSDAKGLMGQYMSDGSLNVATWSVQPADWQTAYDTHDAAAVREQYRKQYADWSPKLTALLEHCDDAEVTPRDLYMLPIGHKWPHRQGVTLVGDAAHVMTPFAGEGVNLAMQDSLKLADAILAAAAAPESLDSRVAAFEQDMFTRATATQQMTYDMLSAMYYTPGAPRTSIESYITCAVRGTSRSWLSWFITPVVYSWFFVFKLIW